MSADHHQFELNYKKLGLLTLNGIKLDQLNGELFQSYIKVLLFPSGYTLTVDFRLYETTTHTLFFVAPNQYLNILSGPDVDASMIYYNRDFYCIQMHDAEVACDGLLFNNIFEVPYVEVDDLVRSENSFRNIVAELQLADSSSEELIRTYLKQLILLATRQWKKQNLENRTQNVNHTDKEFFRNFGRLVDIHYKKKHSVTDYAELMNLSPKTLANKFNKLHLDNPNDIIKKRIVLEAKRLLFYTDLNVKEIAYQLGYEDPAYFNRLFTQKTGTSPLEFKKGIKE